MRMVAVPASAVPGNSLCRAAIGSNEEESSRADT
jgi:hypothetical protein